MGPDSPRYLHLSSSLRSALLLYRLRHDIVSEPVLDREALRRTERTLGLCLPDNVLAAFAATGRRLTEILHCHEQALRWSDFPERYVAFASDPLEDETGYWCTLVARQPLAKLGIYRWVHDHRAESHPVPTSSWVQSYYKLSAPSVQELTLIQRLSPQFYPRIEGHPKSARPLRDSPGR